jgi:competence protein ComFC
LRFQATALLNVMREITTVLVDFVYPSLPLCTLCGQPFYQRSTVQTCEKCMERLNFVSRTACAICGRPLLADSLKRCHDCTQVVRLFDCGRGVGVYAGQLKEYILDLKYRGRWDLAEPFGELMGEFLKAHCELLPVDVIVPVPLHMQRLAERGYNQAELLVKHVGRMMKVPVSCGNLVRTRATLPQKGLKLQERIENMSGAFGTLMPGDIQDKSVLLVDDIFTTGITANECTKALLLAGARQVKVLVLAIGA